MPNLYITTEELRRRLAKTSFTSDELADANIIVEAVSRGADNEVGVVPGFFTPSTVPATRRLYSKGTSFIPLPAPLSGVVTITSPAAVPNFTVADGLLVALTEDGIPSPFVTWGSTYYDVTGIWGLETVPAELKEACLQWATRLWQSKAGGFSGVVTAMRSDGTLIEGSIPPGARLLLQGLKQGKQVESSPPDNFYIA